ncbi:MAG: twin transmembrane helix small protein [Neorhizobium sp.]|jgi:heme/copper-type cytochrome/quinol oxidase subunit 2|nr:twin transmembrane helix small protein [Neorhizobium sp.]
MSSFTAVIALIVMGLVVLVLIRGLYNMMKGRDASTSNKLMQLRVMLQAIAVILIMLTLWITGGGRPG